MAKTLTIASGLKLPIDIAGQTIGLLGIRGSGKTNTAGVIAEELLDHHQPIVVIDPTDAWWGLRSGFPVFIFGGDHGDIALNETDGKLIAEFIVTEQVPVILSIRHLRKNAQRRFVADFCEELYHLKGKDKYRSPLTVFIDEAPVFVPQAVPADVMRTVGAVEDLVARGRSAGFGVVLISQRAATINKNVLTQADTIIAHRLTGPHDKKALGEWIEENATVEKHKEILTSLAGMPNGKAWIWSPRLDIMVQAQIRLRHTFDSSASPKVGEKVVTPKNLKDIDLGKLKDKMAAAVESKKSNDPTELKKKVTALEKQLAAKLPVISPKVDESSVRKAVEKERAQFRKFLSKVNRPLAILLKEVDGIHTSFKGLQTEIDNYLASEQPVDIPAASLAPRLTKPTIRPVEVDNRPRNTGNSGTNENALSRCERAILTVLAQRDKASSKSQVAILSGYSSTSGGFNNSLSKLRTSGFIIGMGDSMTITDDGLLAVGDYEPLPTGEDLHRYWYTKLSKSEAAILAELIRANGSGLTKEEIAEATGYSVTSGGFNNSISRLRTLELAEGYGKIKASDSLFE